MILSVSGVPIPPSDVIRKLQGIDEHLGLSFYSYPKPCWALTWRWLSNDPRRQMIQQGQMNLGDDFDILCWLPSDCTPDDALGYVERSLVRFGGRKQEVESLLNRVHDHNLQQAERNMEPTLELADELFKTNAPTLFSDEGKTIPKTKAAKSKKNTDEKLWKEYLMDSPAEVSG